MINSKNKFYNLTKGIHMKNILVPFQGTQKVFKIMRTVHVPFSKKRMTKCSGQYCVPFGKNHFIYLRGTKLRSRSPHPWSPFSNRGFLRIILDEAFMETIGIQHPPRAINRTDAKKKLLPHHS